MPTCPVDPTVQLTPWVEDANTAAGSFWECPVHGGRYISHGLAGLIPTPRAVTSHPPAGFRPVLNFYVNPSTKELWIVYDEPGTKTTLNKETPSTLVIISQDPNF